MCSGMRCPYRRTWTCLGAALLDVVIAAAFVAMVVAEATAPTSSHRSCTGRGRRGHGRAGLASTRPMVVAAVVVVDLLLNPDHQFSTLLALVLVSFTVGSETVPPRSHVGLALVLVPFVAAMVAAGLEPSDLGAALVFVVGPWAVGVGGPSSARRPLGRRSRAPTGWSRRACSRLRGPPRRSAPGSPGSCTTSCPTR